MQLNITNSKETMNVSDDIFATEFNESLVHQLVTAYLAGGRQGTVAQKSRSEVSGGGAKPWRQKGTGRARAGTIRSPLWRTGGITFAAKPRSYKQKLPKKMYRAGMRSILGELVRQERLIVVKDFVCQEAKTKQAVKQLAELNATSALVIKDSIDDATYFAVRNIPHIELIDTLGINPVILIRYDKVIITEAAMKNIEERLA